MLRRTCALLSIAFALSLYAATVAATTAKRTFVSTGGVNNPACSLVAPCRDFTTAIAATAAGGEVIVLDSGGYGPATITQSVSIIAPAGIYAGISVLSGNGITVNGSNIVVTLRGLTINGQGGSNGIVFTSGERLIVDRCTISNMALDGILLQATSLIKATLTNVRVEGSGGAGVMVSDHSDVLIADSQFSYNSYGVLVVPQTVGSPAQVHIERIIADHSVSSGILVNAFAAAATAYVSGSQIVRNTIGMYGTQGGFVYATDNRIVANYQRGIYQDALGSFVLSNNVISRNGLGAIGGGIEHHDPGYVFTMQNNVVRDNPGGNILGGPLSILTFD